MKIFIKINQVSLSMNKVINVQIFNHNNTKFKKAYSYNNNNINYNLFNNNNQVKF